VDFIVVGMGTPLRLLCIVAAEWPSFVTSVMQFTHSNHNRTWSDDLPQLFLWTRLHASNTSSCRNYLERDRQPSDFKNGTYNLGRGKVSVNQPYGITAWKIQDSFLTVAKSAY
jgi:hypothetical protein